MSTSSLRDDPGRALRQVTRHPGHAAVVLLVLSLGFGASTAVSSVADAVLLRPLPVEDPSGLVLFQWTSGPNPPVEYLTGEWWPEPATGRVTASSFSCPAFEALALPRRFALQMGRAGEAAGVGHGLFVYSFEGVGADW